MNKELVNYSRHLVIMKASVKVAITIASSQIKLLGSMYMAAS